MGCVLVSMALTGRIRSLTKPKLLKLAKAKGVLADVSSFMDFHASDKVRKLQMYPPPKAGSRYIRTFNLQRGWRIGNVTLSKDGFTKRISNTEYYAGLVHGGEQGTGQLGMHSETGWPLFAEVIREGYARGIRKVVHNALQ